MGWQDRDYSDEFGDSVSAPWRVRRPPPVTLALLVLHGAAFLLVAIAQYGNHITIGPLLALGDEGTPLLGIIAHPFASPNLIGALFTVLALWTLGGRLEPRLGPWKLLGVYAVGNVAAGTIYYTVARLQPALATARLDYPAGALAAWCVLAWRQLQHEPVQVFGRTTTAGRVFAFCGLAVIVFALLGSQTGAVAWLAAVGAGCGVAVVSEHAPERPGLPRRRRRPARAVDPSAIEDPYIDDILAKISQSGLGSLTDAERARLEAARQAKLRRRAAMAAASRRFGDERD